ncbi:DNA-methyltransferase [Pragia fontium]|uniref:DNA-methyltransferase n=1 Tax=Pragia fontium TaxID=82985 RepID=UPI00064B2750|nr:site-specific DNA-methyltransferase [Pragia fontium]AKJ41766.1 hypothetical protein QQ39_06440 [Pragia fontium]
MIHNLMQGDCLELMRDIPSASADLILTDLPYGTTQCKWDAVIPFEPMWEQYNRIIKPAGVIALNAAAPFDKALANSNIKDFRYEWIWEKSNATGYLNAKKMPLKAHENVLIFYRQLPTYNPQKTTGHKRKTAVKRVGKAEVYGKQIFNEIHYDSTDRYPRSVLKFASDKQVSSLHPTQKPVALAEYFIKTYTNPGQIVLDSCMGSGTTGIACMNTERQFIGIEIDEHYFDISSNRISEHAATLLDGEQTDAE